MRNHDFYYNLSHNKLNSNNNYQSYLLIIKILISNGITYDILFNQLIKKLVKHGQIAELRLLDDGKLVDKISDLNLIPQVIRSGSIDMLRYLANFGHTAEFKNITVLDALYYLLNFTRDDTTLFEDLNGKSAIKLIEAQQFEIFKYVYRRMLPHGSRYIYYYGDLMYKVITSENLPTIKLVLSTPLIPHTIDYLNFITYANLTHDSTVIKLVEQYQPANLILYTKLKQAIEQHDVSEIKENIKMIDDMAVYLEIIDDYSMRTISTLNLLIKNLSFEVVLDILIRLLTDRQIDNFKDFFDDIIAVGDYQLVQQLLSQIIDQTASSLPESYKKTIRKYNDNLIKLITKSERKTPDDFINRRPSKPIHK